MVFGSGHNCDDLTPSSERKTHCLDEVWPRAALALFTNELNDLTEPNTQDLLPCGQELNDTLKVAQLDPEIVRPKLALGREWRRLYTDAILLRCLTLLAENHRTSSRSGEPPKTGSATGWEHAVRELDLAIVLAGAPGEGRLDLTLACISYIQHHYLPLDLGITKTVPLQAQRVPPTPLATPPVPVINPAPSLSAFSKLAHQPLVLPGLASSWPATSHWMSQDYLQSCAGRGRVVPVERGGDYRTDEWSVDMMPWDEFLDKIGWGKGLEGDNEGLYLAQHSLFTQFPKLRADIIVPDYVYVDPPASDSYRGPPGNDEQLVINAWCGGRGANSPAHTDPYYNIYVQVVGHKSIWLAPPEASSGMYAFNSSSEDNNEPNRDPKREGMLGNTSSIDVFTLSTAERGDDPNQTEAGTDAKSVHPLFYSRALPLAQSTILGPGDALVIPPGWWHAMRGAGESFSVSFWF